VLLGAVQEKLQTEEAARRSAEANKAKELDIEKASAAIEQERKHLEEERQKMEEMRKIHGKYQYPSKVT
jgi:hypothetical protein